MVDDTVPRIRTDSILIKLIGIILIQKGLDNSSRQLRRRKSSIMMLKEAIQGPPSPIQPAPRYYESFITPEARQLLQGIQSVLGIEPVRFQVLVATVIHSYQSDYLMKDVLLYRHSLFNRMSTTDLHLSDGALSNWKSSEEGYVIKILRSPTSTPYFALDGSFDNEFFLITVQDARGLKPKDTRTSNNTYVHVTFSGVSWISPIIPTTLNPIFNYSIAIAIGKEAREAPIQISLWNRNIPKDINKRGLEEKEDAFLGCILLSRKDLIRMAANQEILDAPLQKRSGRSHVAGNIRIGAISLKPESLEIREIYGRSFHLMIADSKINFKALIKACFEFDFAVAPEKKPDACLSKTSKEIITLVASVWRMRPVYVSICIFQTAFSLFRQGSLLLDHLYDYYLDAFNMISDADAPSKSDLHDFSETAGAALDATNTVLRTFFNSINLERSKALSGAQLEKIIVINTSIFSSPLLKLSGSPGAPPDSFQHIKSLLEASLTDRYQNLVGVAQNVDPDLQYPLSALAVALNEELILYTENFDIMVMEKIHLPTLAANIFYNPLAGQLENLANTYKSSSPDMTILFELYDSVRKFQKTCESIDFRLAEKFQMVKWFGPFVKEWLSYSEQKLVEWVRAALAHDNLEKVSSEAPHTSSVLDIFTSFQQLIDFLKNLDWPNEVENRKFYFAVFYDILEALYRYCQFSTELMVSLLRATQKFQPPPPPSSAKVGKFKVPIPKMYRKKIARPLREETRISTKACFVLLNIFALPARFTELIKSIPELNDPRSENESQGNILDSDRFLFCITILNGNLKPVRPRMTEIAVKVTNNIGKEQGMTAYIQQNKQISWNESIYGLHNKHSSTLTLGIWHHIEGQKDALYSIGQISTAGVKENVLEGKVKFENYGHIYVRLERLRDHPTALVTITKWIVDSTTAKMINLLVEQLSYDFRERIHDISLKYKTNVIKATFFKEKIEPLTDSDIAEIEQYLSPFFDFLNTNLEVLMTSMDEALALEVVLGSWNRFVADAEALIVPTLYDDVKERKQWDERRFQFFRKLVEIAHEFFMGDGQGLSKTAIQTRQYVGLQFLMQNYFIPKEEAADRYLQSNDEALDKLWLLKLIKMKGGKEFVESQLDVICGI